MENKRERSNKTVYLADDLSQILYHLNSINSLLILAGGTQVGNEINENCVSIRKAKELTQFEKHDRFIDFGAAVSLSKCLSLGKENIPEVLYDAISTIADNSIRNMATIGGNICAKGHKYTLWAPLIALNARVEIRNKKETLLYPMSKFTGIEQGSILTKIRIPLDEWDLSIFKRLGPSNYITEDSASFVFLADTQKDIISNVRIAFTGPVTFYSHELENILIGARLPLNHKYILQVIDEAKKIFEQIIPKELSSDLIRDEVINLLEMSLSQLM
jgi:CO/xanthine dehydrogenase FAD-binding subunit